MSGVDGFAGGSDCNDSVARLSVPGDDDGRWVDEEIVVSSGSSIWPEGRCLFHPTVLDTLV